MNETGIAGIDNDVQLYGLETLRGGCISRRGLRYTCVNTDRKCIYLSKRLVFNHRFFPEPIVFLIDLHGARKPHL